MQKRDERLDYLKGVSCLMMILAHSKVEPAGTLLKEIIYLGGFAPVLFFGVSGITSTLQLKKRTLKELTIFYIVFFFLGFSFNGIEQVKYWQYAESEILQCIAVNTVISATIYKLFDFRKIVWLIPIPFGIHLISYQINFHFPLQQFLINPGIFPVFPWLSFFLLGIYVYYNTQRSKVMIMTVSFITFIFAVLIGNDYHNKWNMSLGYYVLGVWIFLGLYYLAGKIKNKNILLFTGKNSLLFLFCHYFVLRIVAWFGLHIPLLVWSINLLLTIILMKILLIINHHLFERSKSIFSSVSIWVVILLIVLLNPVLAPPDWVYMSSYLIGALIAANYHHLLLIIGRVQKDSKNRPLTLGHHSLP